MRVTDSLKYDTLSANVETSLSNLNAVQQQISTGKQLTTFSDDPAGASQSLALRSALADNAQYQRDSDQANSFLSASDSALSSATDIIQSARPDRRAGREFRPVAGQFLRPRKPGGRPDSAAHAGCQHRPARQIHFWRHADDQSALRCHADLWRQHAGNHGDHWAKLCAPDQHARQHGFRPAFTALKTLKTDLTAGNVANISADIAQVDSGLSAISTARATIGAKADEVTAVSQRLTRAQNEYQDGVSKIEDVNLATAYVQLQSAQNVYQASLATTSKAFQYSLSDYLH